jgi:hypothetical protein
MAAKLILLVVFLNLSFLLFEVTFNIFGVAFL